MYSRSYLHRFCCRTSSGIHQGRNIWILLDSYDIHGYTDFQHRTHPHLHKSQNQLVTQTQPNKNTETQRGGWHTYDRKGLGREGTHLCQDTFCYPALNEVPVGSGTAHVPFGWSTAPGGCSYLFFGRRGSSSYTAHHHHSAHNLGDKYIERNPLCWHTGACSYYSAPSYTRQCQYSCARSQINRVYSDIWTNQSCSHTLHLRGSCGCQGYTRWCRHRHVHLRWTLLYMRNGTSHGYLSIRHVQSSCACLLYIRPGQYSWNRYHGNRPCIYTRKILGC